MRMAVEQASGKTQPIHHGRKIGERSPGAYPCAEPNSLAKRLVDAHPGVQGYGGILEDHLHATKQAAAAAALRYIKLDSIEGRRALPQALQRDRPRSGSG